MDARPGAAGGTTDNPADLTAVAARDLIAAGKLSAVAYVEACLARIAEREPTVGAWTVLDPDGARRQARAADNLRRSGRPFGPLLGLPVGIKDIIDTADMPTENGTVLDAGRKPRQDAAIVSRLRGAGAILPGKTVTTELAYFSPGKTANPHDPTRTPGVSSSGSAAAVAAGMVPFAVGTQTAGSVIRPASFCGVVGFKPTHGLIPRTGILTVSPPLDTVGVFARNVEDAALLADALAGYDEGDPDSRPDAPPRLLDLASSEQPFKPMIGFVRQPAWGEADPATREAFAELISALGDRCQEVPLPPVFDQAAAAHRAVMHVGMVRSLRKYREHGAESLSGAIREAMEQGAAVNAVDYLAALELREGLYDAVDQILTHYGAILTPAAPGEAPEGLQSTGSPAFNSLWTFLGVPAVTLPLMEGPNGLPLGVQLIGRRGYDGRLLRTARWLTGELVAA